MGLADVIVIFLLTYYSLHIGKMIFSRKKRLGMQKLNKDMDTLRKKPLKTVDEQKRFLDLKYPKSGPFKWKWSMIPNILFTIILYIAVFRGWLFLWELAGITIKFWQAVIFIIVFPIALNYLLEKFNIQKGDLRYMLRW